MDKMEIKPKYEVLTSSTIVIFGLFLIIVIIFFAVQIQNGIKSGKYIGQGSENRNTINVTGVGEVYSKPDLATMSFSVISSAKTVEEATAGNTGKMNAVIGAVKGQGVEDKDVVTVSYNIVPTYDYIDAYEDEISYRGGKRVLSGYEASQTLMVKIRDLAKIGTIIDAATAAGANESGDLRFTIEDEDSLVAEARAKAIGKAKAKASQLAGELGVSLVKITGFSENNHSNQDYSYASKMMDSAEGAANSVPSIEPGQNKVQVTVNIAYEIY